MPTDDPIDPTVSADPIDLTGPEPLRAIAGRDEPAARVADLGRRRRNLRAFGIIVAAAAIAVAVAVWPRDATRTSDHDLAAALATPGARSGELRGTGPGAAVVTKVVVRADGTGVADARALPDAGAGSVYQLWAIEGVRPISLGVIGQRPGIESFTAKPGVAAIAVSRERAPGAIGPTFPPVASGAVG